MRSGMGYHDIRVYVLHDWSELHGESGPLAIFFDPEQAADKVMEPQSDCKWDESNPSREEVIAKLKSDDPEVVIVEHCSRRGIVKGIVSRFTKTYFCPEDCTYRKMLNARYL